MPKLYFPLSFLFWSASFQLASENNRKASPCRVSFLTIPANRGRNKRTGSSWWRWLLHTDYQAETSLRFYWNNASLAFTESSPVFILMTLPSARNSVLWSRWSRFYHRSNLALCFLHWLLTALYLDLGWTFQNSVLPQIFQISKSHSIILYPRFLLNLKSLKPNRLRILEWFPFDKFSASVYKTGWPLVKQFSNPQCTPWLLLSRRKKKNLITTSFPGGFPGGSESKICLQCGRPWFHPWIGKTPWKKEWQPTPVFLPGEFHGQRSLAGSMVS